MKYIQYIIIVIAAVILSGCEDYSANEAKVISVEIESQLTQNDGSIDVSMVIHCDADNVVVWSGTEASSYSAYQELIASPAADEENLTINYPAGEYLQNPDLWGGLFAYTITYPEAGEYELTVIASYIGDFSEDISQDIYQEIITVE